MEEEYKYKEAFCIMTYKCKDCGAEEIIWNSRDGVTPFGINCVACKGQMDHVRWNEDKCVPNYYPRSGERVFIDLTLEAFVIYQRRKICMLWCHGNYPMSERWKTKEEALVALVKDFQPGSPDIVSG